ncbi:Hypothetical predicted protein, partial [Paramuricea clavata]
VLHEGRLVEFDEPYELLQKKSSRFSELVQEVGGKGSEKLLEMARKAHHRRLKENDSAFGSQHLRSNSERSSDERGRDTPNGITDNHVPGKANGTVSSIAEHDSIR